MTFWQFWGQMRRLTDLCLVALMLSTMIMIEGTRNIGRGIGRGRHRILGQKTQTQPFPHKNPASANYYEHEDVIPKKYHSGVIFNYNHFSCNQGAKITKSSHFEFDYMLGRKITFFCMATGYPRPEITWFKDGVELYQHRFFQVTFPNIIET